MKDRMRKRYQRKFNQKMHQLNHSCEVDPLWKGRFVFFQRGCRWDKFSNNSGGMLVVFIRAYDKQTGYYHDYRIDYAPWMSTFNWHLTMDIANTFIVEDLDVWQEKPRPEIGKVKDYTKSKVDVNTLMTKPWNFYEAYKHTDNN